MKLLIFGKKRTSKEGRDFVTYFTKLHKADGTELTTSVKFTDSAGAPKLDECPIYIDVEKKDANLAEKLKNVTDLDTGEITQIHDKTLWVKKWVKDPEEFVDTSLDDFVD